MMLTQKLHFFLDRTVRNGFFIISDLPFSHLGMGTDGSVLETSGDSLVKANEDLVQDRQCFNFNDFFWTKLAKVFEPLTFFNALFGVFVLGESCVTKSNVSVWKLKASVVTCPKKTCVENSKKSVLVTTSFEQPHVFLRPPPPIEKNPPTDRALSDRTAGGSGEPCGPSYSGEWSCDSPIEKHGGIGPRK